MLLRSHYSHYIHRLPLQFFKRHAWRPITQRAIDVSNENHVSDMCQQAIVLFPQFHQKSNIVDATQCSIVVSSQYTPVCGNRWTLIFLFASLLVNIQKTMDTG